MCFNNYIKKSKKFNTKIKLYTIIKKILNLYIKRKKKYTYIFLTQKQSKVLNKSSYRRLLNLLMCRIVAKLWNSLKKKVNIDTIFIKVKKFCY